VLTADVEEYSGRPETVGMVRINAAESGDPAERIDEDDGLEALLLDLDLVVDEDDGGGAPGADLGGGEVTGRVGDVGEGEHDDGCVRTNGAEGKRGNGEARVASGEREGVGGSPYPRGEATDSRRVEIGGAVACASRQRGRGGR
jgi:hypothetical protein